MPGQSQPFSRRPDHFQWSASEGRTKSSTKPEPKMPRLQDVIGDQLRHYYTGLVGEPVPEKLTRLVETLAERGAR